MTLCDQIAIGQQKINLLLEGLQELNEERLMQEEANTLMAITQTFDLLIQILVERKENLLVETKAIYEEAFASVYQRRKDAQTMIANIEKLEEESNTATTKPLYQAEGEISCLKRKYEDLLLATDEQIADIRNPVCSFELEQEPFLSGLLDLSNEVDGMTSKESVEKRPLCKSHSQSINNGTDSSSPDVQADRPNTAANHIGSDTPILSSPEKKRRLPLAMREYAREPNGYNRSTPTLDRVPCREYQFEKNDRRDKLTSYVSLERSKAVNGDTPFLRKAIPSDKLVIQTNYPNSQHHNSFSSPQFAKKTSVKNKPIKKVNGVMEGGAVGMGVRRVNSCDTAEGTDPFKLQRYGQKENCGRRVPLRRLLPSESLDLNEENNNSNGNNKKKNKNLLQSYKTKKSDSKSVREIVKTLSLSLNSKQKMHPGTETKF